MNERLPWIIGGLALGLLLVGGGVVAVRVYATTQEAQANEKKYAPVIQAAEIRNALPAGLLHRQLYQESHFRTDIISGATVSSAGAIGIAQIVPRWHPNVNPYDPIASIDYAAAFMRQLYDQFGSWSAALAAYNWGQGNELKDLQDGIIGNDWPPETQAYVAQITSDVGVT